MTALGTVGRRFFAAGFLGFAGLEVVYAGAASAYAAAAFFLVVGLVLVFLRGDAPSRLRYVLLAAAALIFVFAVLRQLPGALADTHFGPAWFNLAKWLAYVGGLVAIAGLSPWAARPTLGAFLVVCGIQHFLFTTFVATLVPAWIPGALYWTYFAGAALIAAGLGMNVPPTGRLAALLAGGMIVTWIVILHIPRALAAAGPAQLREEWNSVFEALTFSGLAFVVAGAWATRPTSRRPGEPGARP